MSLGHAVQGLRALRRQFPHVDAEAIEIFCGDEAGPLDADSAAALAEMQLEALKEAAGARAMQLPTRACNVAKPEKDTEEHDDSELLEIVFEGGDDAPRVGTVLLISGLETATELAVAAPTGEVLALQAQPSPVCFHVTEYGVHELRLQMPSGPVRRCRFMVSSQLGDFTEAMDHFYDAIDWVWDGGWTEDLEEAVFGLLIAVDEYFTTLDVQLKSSMMGDSMRSSIEPPKKRLENYLAKLVDSQDVLACGRAEACLRNFLLAQSLFEMFSPMMGMGAGQGAVQDSAFYQAVLAFERARFAAASQAKQAEVKAHIRRLIETADAHYAELQGRGKSLALVEKWYGGLRDTMELMLGEGPEAVIHPLPFQQLRGGGGGYMNDMLASMVGSFGGGGGQGATVERAETTEAMSQLAPSSTFEEAEAKVSRWAESLVNESVGFGSPMQPFELHAGEPWVNTVKAALQSVLSLGFGYVAQGGEEKESTSMTILMDRVRASLPLNGEAEFLRDRRRRDRLKDVGRVVRAARRKGQKLTLSVNTDFAGALKALKEHHAESWVGPSLEAVWQTMVPDNRAFVFELWLTEPAEEGKAEPPAPRLVAADFGHPHTRGKAYYVATRFFDRELKTLQPGFILAFAEAMCLKNAGVELWDLGGADASPMMHYKPQVAVEMGRSEFLRRLRELSEPHGDLDAERRRKSISEPEAAPEAGGEAIPTGVVFEDLQEDHLWGAAALREKEAKAKAAAAAAQKAMQKEKSQKGMQKVKGAKAPKKVASSQKPSAEQQRPAHEAADAGSEPQAPAAEPSRSPEHVKAEFKEQFMVTFQKLLAEGVSQTEAAARALKVVAQ